MQLVNLRSVVGLSTLLISIACDAPTEENAVQELEVTHAFELCNPTTLLPSDAGKVKGLTDIDWVNRSGDALRFQFTPNGSTEYEWLDGEDADLEGAWTRSERTLNAVSRYEDEDEPDLYSVRRHVSYFATTDAALYHSSCGALVFLRAFGDSDEDDPSGLNGIWAAEAQSESYELGPEGPMNVHGSREAMRLAIIDGSVEAGSISCKASTSASGKDDVDKSEIASEGDIVGSASSFQLTLVPQDDEEGASHHYLGKMLGDNALILYPTDEDTVADDRTDCTRLDE